MDKKEAFEILMISESGEIKKAAELVLKNNEVEIIKKPEQGLLMFRAVESVDESEFNVGEILITSCEARIKDKNGYAMICGMDSGKAEDCAVIMAAIEAETREKDQILQMIGNMKNELIEKLRFEREIINSTKVRFDIMGGQDKSVAHNKV